MKFALVDGNRHEAIPGIRAVCPGCGSPVVAKCGLKRLHHWAHRSTITCDRWSEPETEWHRGWKNEFPPELQEIRYHTATGEIHIADVRTASGIVLEFQHSPISAGERGSREAFYGSMAWVVNGRRLKRDLSSFRDALNFARPAATKTRGWILSNRCSAIVERWAGSRCPVLLDFAEADLVPGRQATSSLLWWLRYSRENTVLVMPLLRQSVIEHYLSGTPMRGLPRLTPLPAQPTRMGLSGFEAYLAARQARRPRF
ncbi:competence protein CoiA family protein [Rhizobium sp. 1399]|uniref:competence protein CoiA n=1 Tax=Rhizobium sp. 1399 TaxID=2817758 RepID=UPI002862ABE1|nr:competence protein CoiA family protein [Rhizobium sp. 1399]MDR6670194.1 hypothetical protein [Rhizobium sp. 1399]